MPLNGKPHSLKVFLIRYLNKSAAEYCQLNNPPFKAKEYIRRAKAWRNIHFAANGGRPSSYLMSLLVVRAYENATVHYDRAGSGELVNKFPANADFTHIIICSVTRELKELVKNPWLE